MEEVYQEKLESNHHDDFRRFSKILEDRPTCPITLEVMETPMILRDGVSYEQSQIKEWLYKNNTSPSSRDAVDIQIQNRAQQKSDSVINALEIEIKNYIQESHERLNNLQEKNNESSRHIHYLEEDNEKLSKRATAMTSSFNEERSRNSKLLEEIGGLNVQVDTLEYQNKRLKNKIKNMKADVEYNNNFHNERWEKCNKELLEKDELIAQLQEEVEALKDRVGTLKDKKNILKEKMEDQENTVETLKDYLKAQMPHTAMANAVAAYFSREYFKLKQAHYPIRYYFENKLGYHGDVFGVIQDQNKVLEQYRIFHEEYDLSNPQAIEEYIEYFDYGIHLNTEKRKVFRDCENTVLNLTNKLKNDMQTLYRLDTVEAHRDNNGIYNFTPSWGQRNGQYINRKGTRIEKKSIDLTTSILSASTIMDVDAEFANMKPFELDFTPYYHINPNSVSTRYEFYHSHAGHISTYASKYEDLKKGIETAKSYIYEQQWKEKESSRTNNHNINNRSGSKN